MSVRAQVISGDVQKQVSLLGEFDAVTEKRFREAMQQSTTLLSNAIEPNIPTLTGTALATFGVQIEGSGTALTGYVGWRHRPTAWWMNIVEYGARRHDLTPKSTMRTKGGMRQFQRMQDLGITPKGRHIMLIPYDTSTFKTMSIHPGFRGRFILTSAYEENEQAVEEAFNEAAEMTLGELVVNG